MDQSLSVHDRAVEFARRWMIASSPQLRQLFVKEVEDLLREASQTGASGGGPSISRGAR